MLVVDAAVTCGRRERRLARAPQARRGLSFDSMTSATIVAASGCSPGIGSRWSGSRPSRIDSPRRRLSIRPTASSSAATRGSTELPPDTTPSVMPNSRFDRVGQVRELAHVAVVGDDTVAAREVRADAAQLDVRQPEAAGHGVGQVAGHDPFAQVTQLHHEHHCRARVRRVRRRRRAARRARLRLRSSCRRRPPPGRPDWRVPIGSRTIGASMPSARRRSMFSTRESPSADDAGREQHATERGQPPQRPW